ncbi:hypothetical protein EX895_004366 [Sporisorium graminicola]|uniref:Uncharacterized protein n=1 Tax=Sporisorium graminicola TaxID=280036 RepID=A0A4U7KRS1_9BASI|nr:hypothetical protein EX895_004366 [Sporisorium graminicola]TKY86726.1 hypothetical protein EX895_004366 [Sporisorium graminicola]
MGLFTSSSSASRRPASAAPLKRRSLGRSRESLSNSIASANNSQAGCSSVPLSNGGVGAAEQSLRNTDPQGKSALSDQSIPQLQTQPLPATTSKLHAFPLTAQSKIHSDDEDEHTELADLQSDNTFLYDRQLPLDSALGTGIGNAPEPNFLERISAYVAEHYLDCFGITHHKELVRHDNRLVPFIAKAPRFLSIHSLRRKELERDYTEVTDTVDTCPREQLCLGRCLLGFSCPIQDLSLHSSVL